MFTDNPVTPVRLEILVDLLRRYPRGLPRKDVYRLLQPEPLSKDLGNGSPSVVTVGAGIELRLIEQDSGGLSVSSDYRNDTDPRESILKAIDLHVLSGLEVEKYLALFYAYYLGLGKEVYSRRSQDKQAWADQFNADVYNSEPQENPFNDTKLTGLHRWLNYAGLGWYDPAGNFQANPYNRLLRALPGIFSSSRKLGADDFMKGLAPACPELDGGGIFQRANRKWNSEEKVCSLGLSHALIELHEDGIIQLACPADAGEGLPGWSLREAEPPRDDFFKSDLFTTVEWRKKLL